MFSLIALFLAYRKQPAIVTAGAAPMAANDEAMTMVLARAA